VSALSILFILSDFSDVLEEYVDAIQATHYIGMG
jgi:hypothetical protein